MSVLFLVFKVGEWLQLYYTFIFSKKIKQKKKSTIKCVRLKNIHRWFRWLFSFQVSYSLICIKIQSQEV